MSQEVQRSGKAGLPSLTGTAKIILPNIMSQQLQKIKYNKIAAMCLGIVQMNLGVLCIISNIVMAATSNNNMSSFMFYGIWGGILPVVAGLLEVLSSLKTPNICLIIGSMVMSIVAACVSAIVFSLGVVEAFMETHSREFQNRKTNDLVTTFAIILTISALAEIVISIIGSTVCCAAFCCDYSTSIPINVNMDGNQLVKDDQPTNSYYQALAKPPN